MAESAIRLNLGCGHKLLEDYINCDLAGNWSDKKPDVECDIRKLPFGDNYADEAMAIHVLEHFYLWECEAILAEWKRVLKPGGKLIIEVPCFEKIMTLARNPQVLSDPKLLGQLVFFGLFGDPGYRTPEMAHKWCFSIPMLKSCLASAGFKELRVKEPTYHVPCRDMRIEGVK